MKPIISIIAAVGAKSQLGLNGKIPWDNKKDLQRFKYITLGKPVIMGRKTYESIGRPLMGRQNVILTTQDDYNAPMCNTAKNLKDAIAVLAQNRFNSEIFIIGGESLYREALSITDMLYITHVNYNGPADTYMPQLTGNWNRVYNETDADGSIFEIMWRS